jgi:hypothetical protein
VSAHATREAAREASSQATGDSGARAPEVPRASVLAVREGHGANCSSIGSVIDTLFATATVGAAVFAAVAAALMREPVHVVGGAGPGARPSPAPPAPSAPRTDGHEAAVDPAEPPGGTP